MSESVLRFWRRLEDLLHARLPTDRTGSEHFVLFSVASIVILGGLFGAAMGSYGDVRPLQMFYSALKIPLLLLISFLLTIPSFYALNALCGLRGQFKESLRCILAAQVGITALLASLAPLSVFWYAAVPGYSAAKVFNFILFALGAGYGWILLKKIQHSLTTHDRTHRLVTQVWILQFAFVAIQLTWILRPFIGKPGRETRFLREEAWGNAYVELTRMVLGSLGG